MPRAEALSIEVSIVIVNYNVKDLLLQCLRSIDRAARNMRAEVTVVDNNSTDGSVDYLRPLFPQVEFIGLGENIGFGRANNLAIEKAQGEFILFLNPDTLLQEDTLDVMLAYMRSHPEVGVSGCKVLNPDGSFQLACRRSFPTAWTSFCKLSGLQRLFPRSGWFVRYNQTFRSEDETYFVDAVSGSFMFVRRSALENVGGFDADFFMYGEDLDLCYRISQAGWKIAYVHETTLIHYKGESAKRSPLNRVKTFYEAMQVFVHKHHKDSRWFLVLLRLAIQVTSLLAHVRLHRRPISVLLLDTLSINFALLLSTKLRFGTYFGFPSYAYPIVFFALTSTTIASMFVVGEYFESRPSLTRVVAGLLLNFFLLSSLTYFFNQYAFSRGVLLMTIAFAILLTTIIRGGLAVYDRSLGNQADRRIAIVGMNEPASRIIRALQSAETRNADLVGIVTSARPEASTFSGLPIIGSIADLPELIEQYRLREVIITDDSLQRRDVMDLMTSFSPLSVRVHAAMDYEEVVAARIINEIAGIEPTFQQYNITRIRYRVVKRTFDILTALFMLSLGLPVVYLVAQDIRAALERLAQVARGKLSFVGLYPLDEQEPVIGRYGLTGLAHISKPLRLSPEVIRELNDYYVKHYSLTLDFDILMRELLRRIRGV